MNVPHSKSHILITTVTQRWVLFIFIRTYHWYLIYTWQGTPDEVVVHSQFETSKTQIVLRIRKTFLDVSTRCLDVIKSSPIPFWQNEFIFFSRTNFTFMSMILIITGSYFKHRSFLYLSVTLHGPYLPVWSSSPILDRIYYQKDPTLKDSVVDFHGHYKLLIKSIKVRVTEPHHPNVLPSVIYFLPRF